MHRGRMPDPEDQHTRASWGRRLAEIIWRMRYDALIALMVIAAAEGLANLVEGTSWWEVKTRADRDWFMRGFSGTIIRSETAYPLAFIDIDDAALKAWDRPLITPRRYLLRLIQYAAAGGAMAVIVDVGLTRPNTVEDDGPLLDYLQGYGTGAKGAPPLIFIRDFNGQPKHDVVRSPLHSVIDDAVLRNGARVYFASVAFERDDDQVVRRWRLWERICRNGTPAGVPSVELLTLSIADDPEHPNRGPAYVDASLSKAVGGLCPALFPGTLRRLDFNNHETVDLYPDEFGERILFTLPWPVRSSTSLMVGVRRWDKEQPVRVRAPLLVHLPALPIVDNDSIATDPVRDRLVVIGGSNAESRDTFLTPIGAMPGAMVLLNSINSLLQQGQLHKTSAPLGIAVGVTLGILVWLCLYVFRFAVAITLSGVGLSVLVWALASQWISAGIWLDLSLPTLAMLLHQWFEVLRTLWHDRHRHGWRAILTERFRRDATPAAAPRVRRDGLIALALMLTAVSLPAAADNVVAGYVTAIDGNSHDFLIQRGQEVITVTYYMEIWVGDRVVVPGKGGVEITLDDDAHPLVVTQESSPEQIVAPRLGPGSLPRALAPVGNLITYWSDTWEHEREAVETRIRDPGRNSALALPLLATSVRQLIVAGTRSFRLAWIGGTPPFRITATGPVGFGGLDLSAGEERTVSSQMLFPEGAYEVRVTDAAGLTVLGAFEATTTAPKLDDSDLAGVPPGIARVLAAARLSDAQDGGWRLEAYERLAQDESRDRAAWLMANRLAQGLSLSELQSR